MPLPLIPLIAAILGFAAILGAGPLAAAVGGWNRLAKFYRAPGPFQGAKQVASGAMGLANYGFSLLLGADAGGLSLETTGFVRTGHAPLFIPWTDLQAEEVSGLFGSRVFIGFSKAPGIILRLRKKTVLELKQKTGIPQAFQGIQ